MSSDYERTIPSCRSKDNYYNFCLNTTPYDFQPSGAMNLSKFKNIELELTTYVPPFDISAQTFPISREADTIGTNKKSWNIGEKHVKSKGKYEEPSLVVSPFPPFFPLSPLFASDFAVFM